MICTLASPNAPKSEEAAISGLVHSVESCGTLDGPGVRFVLFTSGCPLRCQYCHNPDTAFVTSGSRRTVTEVLDEISSYSRFLKRTGGGVTVSGGEPLHQPLFTTAVLEGCKKMGLHTALDTSGYLGALASPRLLKSTDLVLLDIKSFDPMIYKNVTGREVELTLEFAGHLAKIDKPTWIRFVLVPGLTDAPHNVAGVADFVATLRNVERVEVLPFHQMGEYKWKSLGLKYHLANTVPPTEAQLEAARESFRRHGLTVY